MNYSDFEKETSANKSPEEKQVVLGKKCSDCKHCEKSPYGAGSEFWKCHGMPPEGKESDFIGASKERAEYIQIMVKYEYFPNKDGMCQYFERRLSFVETVKGWLRGIVK